METLPKNLIKLKTVGYISKTSLPKTPSIDDTQTLNKKINTKNGCYNKGQPQTTPQTPPNNTFNFFSTRKTKLISNI